MTSFTVIWGNAVLAWVWHLGVLNDGKGTWANSRSESAHQRRSTLHMTDAKNLFHPLSTELQLKKRKKTWY